IIGEVKGKDVILVDDMVDTAGTLVKAAEVLKKRGATSVMACCTHGVLSGPAYDRIEKGELDELVISDTIPAKKEIKKITVLTASAIIGEAIRRIHNNESVNSIFNN
ncbi:ribose-phosphate diphosphokinase, partial [Aliarcobacter butzleri]|nr:ribose-phosphate diphosphokinase [Aliarcobacter butzleri]